MTAVGLQKVAIKDLDLDMANSIIVCVIIAKQDIKQFASKRPGESDRAVFNFTVRDSQNDYINVTYWGSVSSAQVLFEKFWTGDVVEITKSVIKVRSMGDPSEQFRPAVTSPFSLTLNEGISEISKHEGNEKNIFQKYVHYPTKPVQRYMTLAEMNKNGQMLNGHYVDLLVAVQRVKPYRTMNNGEKRVRAVEIFDRTTLGTEITIWNVDTQLRTEMWEDKKTILFIADAKIGYSNFYRRYVPMIGVRTVITEDPLIREAIELREYAMGVSFRTFDILEKAITKLPNPHTITNVMSVLQVQNKIEAAVYSSDEQEFTALMYVMITKYDLDSFYCSLVSDICTKCNVRVDKSIGVCNNIDECPVALGMEQSSVKQELFISVDISDHTGTLQNCRLNGQNAENVLQCTVDQFNGMTDEEKINLKWKMLLNRCAVRIFVLKLQNSKKAITTILTMEIANFDEVEKNINYY